eukprot:scaffold6428_cov266-Alexandrium_tamarense.AAC.1
MLPFHPMKRIRLSPLSYTLPQHIAITSLYARLVFGCLDCSSLESIYDSATMCAMTMQLLESTSMPMPTPPTSFTYH